MRQSKLFTKTRREAPKDEVSKNAQLLIRAGFIHKEMAGVYSFLPLGLRTLTKIEQIIREEMNAVGGQEVEMSTLQSKELWESAGKWDERVVDVWFKTKLNSGTELGLAFSHEEVIGEMLKNHIASHKDLPQYIYQIQNKFRNETRAKSGVMRTREIRMKDMYSFNRSEEDLMSFYEKAKQAYVRVFERVGIGAQTHVVEADGAPFSDWSHEFQTESEAGEDLVFYVEGSGQYMNREVTPAVVPEIDLRDGEEREMKEVLGKGLIGVEALAEFLDIPVEKTTKTILFETDTGEVIAAAIRGDYDINEIKLRHLVGCKFLQLASPEKVKELTGAEIGYAGMLNLPDGVRQYWDDSTKDRDNFEMGANKTDHHSINVNFGRDVEEPEEFFDFKVVKQGDRDPKTGEVYKTLKTIEVGNIFPIFDKISKQIDLTVLNDQGKPQHIQMGSYGIGINRLLGAIVEVLSDEKGMVWPESVAPFGLHLVVLGDDESVRTHADELYDELTREGVEVLYDDRLVSAGEKFADSDLIGIPHRVVVSAKTIESNTYEVVERRTGDVQMLTKDELTGRYVRKT